MSWYAGPLTIFLWLSSFVGIAIAFWKTNSWKDESHTLLANLTRGMFCILVGLSIWSVSIYLVWMLGFDLKVGTIENGEMKSHSWLPPLTVVWTVLTYYAAKTGSKI